MRWLGHWGGQVTVDNVESQVTLRSYCSLLEHKVRWIIHGKERCVGRKVYQDDNNTE